MIKQTTVTEVADIATVRNIAPEERGIFVKDKSVLRLSVCRNVVNMAVKMAIPILQTKNLPCFFFYYCNKIY